MEQTSVSASAFFFDRCELNNTEQALEVPVSVYGKGGELTRGCIRAHTCKQCFVNHLNLTVH